MTVHRKTKSPKRDWTKSKYAGLLALVPRELKEGVAYEAVWGADFTCTPAGFAGQVCELARSRGMRATCMTTSTRVIYRFYNPKGYWRPNLAVFPVVIKARRADGR